MNNNDKIVSMVAEVLDVEADDISSDSNIESVDEWDSMATVNIMTIICQEFDITPSFDDFEKFTSLEGIKEFVRNRKC